MPDNVKIEFDTLIESLSPEQKLLLEEYFVRQRNRKIFLKLLRFALASGVVIGSFTAIILLAKNAGESFSK